MNTLFESLKFSEFEIFSELIHAVSPRCFENDEGEIEEFSFQGNDETGKAKEHLKHFLESIKIKINNLYLVNQVHGDKVFILDDSNLTFSEVAKISADAVITQLPEKPIGVFTADCLPILVYDPRLKVIGAIHAGRKGTEKNIFYKVIREMARVYGSRPEELIAGFGPAIGGCCYEVGEDCIRPFKDLFPDEKSLFRFDLSGSYFLDLIAVNKLEGQKAGLLPENIFSMRHCTFCSTKNLYSYRREGKTGRILTTIMLRP
jgi:YfiH family protein